MNDKKERKTITTQEARVIWENVNSANKEGRYTIKLFFPKNNRNVKTNAPEPTDLGPLQREYKRAMEEKWGADKAEWPADGNFHKPFAKGKADKPGQSADGVIVNAKSKFKPRMLATDLSEIIDPQAIYAGCYVRVSLHAYWFGEKGPLKGVAFGLDNIQKLRDGERLSGRGSDPLEDFDAVDEGNVFDDARPQNADDVEDLFG